MQPGHMSSGFDNVSYLLACPGRSWHFPVENMLLSLACDVNGRIACFNERTWESVTPDKKERCPGEISRYKIVILACLNSPWVFN